MTEIRIKNVFKTIDKTEILRDFNDVFPSEKVTVILGASGAGKTTTARLISGLEKVTSGEIYFDGTLVSSLQLHLTPQKRKIAYLFQDLALLPHLNVYKNLLLVLKAAKIGSKKARVKIASILDEFSLAGKEKRKIDELSGGEKQRVALARAILQNPKILILDEPFSALDNQLKTEINQVIAHTIKKYKLTVIIITHNLEEAFEFADKIIFLKNGQVIESGTPYKLYSNPQSLETAKFLGSLNIIDENFIHHRASEFAMNSKDKIAFGVKPEDVSFVDKSSQLSENFITLNVNILKSIQQGNQFVNSAEIIFESNLENKEIFSVDSKNIGNSAINVSSEVSNIDASEKPQVNDNMIKYFSKTSLAQGQTCKIAFAKKSLIVFSNNQRLKQKS